MADQPGADAPSFDPRSWVAAAPASDGTSFDPRSWAGPPSTPAPPAAGPRDRTRWLAGGSAALILAAGALTARSQRVDAPQTPAPTVAAPVATGEDAPPASRRTLNIGGVAELPDTLVAAGVVPSDTATAAKAAMAALGEAAGEIRLEIDLVGAAPNARLTRLAATRGDGAGVTLLAKAGGGYAEQRVAAQLETRVKVVRGELDAESFYTSAVAAGVTDSLIDDFANAFSFDFDLQREVAPGDIFEVAFEQDYNPSGDPSGAPRLLYVSLSTAKKARALYRFLAPGETEPGWFDGNGASTVRSLMRTPVDGARISSTFGFRKHPILGYQKLHKGTDFAAPIGTPMYAAGDATVEVAAPRGAAGNFVILRHDNGWQTRYMHLNRFAPGLVPGARWRQGQQIGEVGTTGRSTGPHLHYEVWIDGAPVDPQSIETGTGKTLAADAMAAFRRERDRIDSARADQAS
ncbi:M23 family metallopeptidase [Sphingomonas sp. Y38-1Y]|uniref:M23 family metallopeptidase n=1 Tax=Sphingomonas sp. Y38-1Y TaxID=3078265 RepID=UPI0028EB3DCF|nr:peptidoglycan DD-metalloendopeptidase family protein [Sphingomonas sp. Y38-1Y]